MKCNITVLKEQLLALQHAVAASEVVKAKDTLRVDLGCGDSRPDDYFGIDKVPGLKVDKVADLEAGIPLPDASASEVRANHVLEHLSDKERIMTEVYRVLKPGGRFVFEVPSTKGEGAWNNPGHVSFWNKSAFAFWTQDNLLEGRPKFEVEKLEEIENGDLVYVRGVLRKPEGVSKAALEPFDRFIPPKPQVALYTELYTVDELWEKWASDKGRVDCEPKLNGFRSLAIRKGSRVELWFEGQMGKDQLGKFPSLKAALEKLDSDFILDCDIGILKDGKREPRPDLMRFNAEKPEFAEDEAPVLTAFDLPYWREDLHDKPFEERRERLEEFDKKHLKGKTGFGITEARWVETLPELKVAARWAFSQDRSEGLVAKTASGKYELEGATDEWCLPPGSPIFAAGSVVPVESVTEGQQLGENRTVIAVESRTANELVEITATGTPPVRATPGHRFEVIKNFKTIWYRKYAAERCYQHFAPISNRRRTPRNRHLPYKREFLEARYIEPGDALILPKVHAEGNLPEAVKSKGPEFFYLLGWYVAEGYCYGGQVRIHLGKNGAETVERLAAIATHYWPSVHVSHYRLSHRLSISSGRGHARAGNGCDKTFLQWFGADAYTKRLPPWHWALDDACLTALLRGYWEGDGSRDLHGSGRVTYQCATASWQLAWQLWWALLRLGVVASLSPQPAQKGKVMWHLHASSLPWAGAKPGKTWWKDCGSFYALPVRRVSRVAYQGPVYHIQTTDEQFLCPVSSHNSKLKRVVELKVIVLQIQQTKTPGTVNYYCGLLPSVGMDWENTRKVGDKEYIDLGKTFSTAQVHAQVGQVITCQILELLPDEEKQHLAWLGARPVDVDETRREPYTAAQAIDIAERGQVLQKSVGEIVPGAGPKNARIMFVGASPGATEAARGEPLVGPSGLTFNEKYLKPLDLARDSVYITNAVGAYLTDDKGNVREPTPEEIEAWQPWLVRQLDEVQPGIVVALGQTAKAALGDRADFTLPHPSAIRRFGDSGELSRKLKQIGRALEEVKKADDEGETTAEAAAKFWADNWFKMFPPDGKGRYTYHHHFRGLSEDESKLDEKELLDTSHSLHGDLRFEADGKLWGFSVFLGTTQDNRRAGGDRLATLPQDDNLQGQFKLAQPTAWLDVGVGKPMVTEPGGVGATSEKYSKFFAYDRGTYEMGCWREHMFEVLLHGEQLKGRFLIEFAPIGGRRVWLIDKPASQTPYAKSHDLADVISELRGKGQKHLIWRDPEEGGKPRLIDVESARVAKEYFAKILKADDEKQLVYGVVLEPETVDTQGDVISADEIEAAVHAFLIRSRVIGDRHSRKAGAEVCECYVAPDAFEMGGQRVKKGSWVLCVHVTDEKLWREIKDGEYTGFSVGGFGVREAVP